MKKNAWSPLLAIIISTAFTGCTSTQHLATAAPHTATFQMRLALDAPSSDSTEMSVIQKTESPTPKEVVYVQNAVLLDQTALKSAKVIKDSLGNPQIAVTFTESGRKRFAEVTRQSIGRRLAIVIDGQLYSVPKIMMEIPSGKANISGGFSDQEAEELVRKINVALK
jgi:preprotein translocase subunit SecD